MHDHDSGLAHDLARLAAQTAERRRALRWLAGTGALALSGCGGGSDAGGTTTTTTTTTTTGGTTTVTGCPVIAEETAGPYPADGSNTANDRIANALTLSGIVRSDIRSSIAGASGVAQGVPLAVRLVLVDANGGCAALAGHAIYLWHCDREGRYSMYSSGVTAENYLRGVQSTAADGSATFTTVFPGCYSGRMPHIHFEVYRSANSASAYGNKLKTSQIALPTDVCRTVYTTASGYGASVANLNAISFATDNVFSDGTSTEMAAVAGSVAAGDVATLVVPIAG